MEFLPRDLVEQLRAAERCVTARGALRVLAGGEAWPVLRRFRNGFSLNARQIGLLRGYVDLYEGARHIATCLIVASEIEGDELICTIKRETAVTDHAALDFVRNEKPPVALIGRT